VWGGTGPGEILAILGREYSHKSLLLKILAGNLEMERGDLMSGQVLANGFTRGERWRRLCVMVSQQSEEYHGKLTVLEQLQFRSKLSLPAKWSAKRRSNVIAWVLDSLGLQGIKGVMVERLNHGERRILSIGLALIGLPRVLLLDEPTEGLDPLRALELMKALRKITDTRQLTTIITAKQLRQASLPLVNKVLLLAQGWTVCYGTVSSCVKYFETRLRVAVPTTGDNPLTCLLDAVNCAECRRSAQSHVEMLAREWEAYAFEHQLYRANYPYNRIDGKLMLWLCCDD
jgi:ABC-type multidrug transport system ATPase subunit